MFYANEQPDSSGTTRGRIDESPKIPLIGSGEIEIAKSLERHAIPTTQITKCFSGWARILFVEYGI